jgi:hypothetical protein
MQPLPAQNTALYTHLLVSHECGACTAWSLFRRQGLGVTGGNPFGFDVGQPRDAPGSALPGIDLGIRGMRVGGQRRLLVPPTLVSGHTGMTMVATCGAS